MDQRLLGIYLSRILSGFYIFIYNNQKYKLVYPDISIKYEAEIYAQEEYEQNKYNDWIQESEIVDILTTIGLWSYNGDENLKNIDKQIEDLKVDLYKNYLNPTKLKSIRKTLNNIKNTYNRLYDIRHSLDAYTLSGHSQIIKNYYLLSHSLYDHNDELVFKNFDDIDYKYLSSLSTIISNNTIDIKIYREIARSEIWKNYWSSNNTNVFDKSVVNWTDEQKTLVVLTKMYESAYQHSESPPDSVFEDDDMFDGWMISQRREGEKNRNKARTEKMLEGKNLNKAGEIFLMANSQEEASNIYGLNESNAAHIIRERKAVLQNTQGTVDVTELPDIQRDIMSQINEKVKNRK